MRKGRSRGDKAAAPPPPPRREPGRAVAASAAERRATLLGGGGRKEPEDARAAGAPGREPLERVKPGRGAGGALPGRWRPLAWRRAPRVAVAAAGGAPGGAGCGSRGCGSARPGQGCAAPGGAAVAAGGGGRPGVGARRGGGCAQRARQAPSSEHPLALQPLPQVGAPGRGAGLRSGAAAAASWRRGMAALPAVLLRAGGEAREDAVSASLC